MIRKNISAVFILIAIGCYGCYDIVNNYQLSITNKSGKEISVLYSHHANVESNENNVEYYLSDQSVIKPDSSRDIIKVGGANAWQEYISKGKEKRLYFFIFETDTLKKYISSYSMDEFVKKQKYFKLISYSEEDLGKINWNVKIDR